jgi:hypothetical protein
MRGIASKSQPPLPTSDHDGLAWLSMPDPPDELGSRLQLFNGLPFV